MLVISLITLALSEARFYLTSLDFMEGSMSA